jgi:hypothetical protein
MSSLQFLSSFAVSEVFRETAYSFSEVIPMSVILSILTTDFSLTNLHTSNVLQILSNSKDRHEHEGYTPRMLENVSSIIYFDEEL